MCLGAIGTSGREALEVELTVNPLEVRRTELSLREVARILSKDVDVPIRSSWEELAGVRKNREIHFAFWNHASSAGGHKSRDRKQAHEPGA